MSPFSTPASPPRAGEHRDSAAGKRAAQDLRNGARRLREFYSHLVKAYGPQQWWPAKSAFEVVIGAYLTQNTAWTAVEKSIANLAGADC